jgi:hypothetical protein
MSDLYRLWWHTDRGLGHTDPLSWEQAHRRYDELMHGPCVYHRPVHLVTDEQFLRAYAEAVLAG